VATALILPRLSRILSVTVKGNDVVPAGRGGAGRRAQLALGIDNTGVVVVCEIVVATV
jgi:hypothetical protein